MKALRKQIAVAFLVLISLQVGGYYAVMEYLKLHLSERTAHRIATEQAPIGGQLVLLVPVNSTLPDAHFTYDGKVYQVIQHHVYNDVMYVVCVRDNQASDAQETIESFVQSLAGKNNNDQGAGTRFFENLTKYFCAEQYSWYTVTTGWTQDLPFGVNDSFYTYNHQAFLFHPPTGSSTIS